MLKLSLSADDLAFQNSPLQLVDPRAKLFVAFSFLIAVSSFEQMNWPALFPMFIYPAVLVGAGLIPFGWLLRRMLAIFPFVAFTSLSIFLISGISYATVPIVISLLIKSCLAVSSTIILVATTGSTSICRALGQLGIPTLITTQILLTLRYLVIISDEAMRMLQARELRSCGRAGLGLSSSSQLITVLFLRSMQRAERVHDAMTGRGFDGELPGQVKRDFGSAEYLYCLAWISFLCLVRFFDISAWIGTVLTGGLG